MLLKRAVPLLFFLGGALLLVFGLGALGAAVFLPGNDVPDGFAWKPPLEQINHAALTPATALLALTGRPVTDTLNLTLDRGSWEDAYALVAFDPDLPDPVRIGTLLQLGTRYDGARQKGRAAMSYLAATRIAAMSPFLSDRVRVDTLLQASAGLRAMGARDAARLAADQGYLVAQYSPTLRREASSPYLTRVADAYAALGADGLAARARGKVSAASSQPAESEVLLPRDPFTIASGALPPSAEVTQAAQNRITAAQRLLASVDENPPTRVADWPPDLVRALSAALAQEDRVRQAYYEQQLAQAQDPAVRVALLRDRAAWLALKYRIARGAFGLTLVGDWQKDPAPIAAAWSRAWGDLFHLYESQAAAIPNPQAVSQATEDVLRQELFAVRWGWYRDASDQELHGMLADISRQLRDASVASLRLDTVTVGGRTVDLLVPDELYGKNEQALPK